MAFIARNGLACRVILGSWPLAESWCGKEMKLAQQWRMKLFNATIGLDRG